MAIILASEQQRFIARMIASGRFGSRSEIVREALRRMERQEADYLNPPPISAEDLQRAYAADPGWDKVEAAAARKAKAGRRRLARSGRSQEDL